MKTRRAVAFFSVFLLTAGLWVGSPASSNTTVYPVSERRVSLEASALVAGAAPVNVEAPSTFTLLGITYEGRSAELEVRTRRAGGGWSRWTSLETEVGEGPDLDSEEHQRSRLGTQPLWTGAADDAQVRVERPVRGLRNIKIHFIDATGASLRPLQKVAAIFRSRLRPAPAAAAAPPPIVSRAQWGADESIKACNPDVASKVKGAIVHHTAGTNSYAPADSAAIVRGIYHYHVKARGFCDIGYNFLIDRYGVMFEGRSGGVTRPVIGAHARGFNTYTTGISLMGNYVDVGPTEASINALVHLLGWKFSIHRVFPRGTATYTAGGGSRFPEGTSVTLSTTAAHKDVTQTACPARLYDRLPEIRSRIVVDFKYPDGTLIKGSAAAVYWIRDGKKRPVISGAAYLSRFRWREIVSVGDFALALHPAGPSIGFREGSLVKTPNGAISIISDGRRRAFVSMQVFEGLNYSLRNVVNISWGEARRHSEGTPIASPAGPHPNGTIVKGSRAAVYFLKGGTKRPIAGAAAYESNFKWREIVGVSNSELSLYPTGTPFGFRDGSLVLTPNGGVWLISNQKKRPFTSAAVFLDMGYSFSNVRSAGWSEANVHPNGTPIG